MRRWRLPTSSQSGDAVLVNPGGRVPVDGTVVSGHSFVDQARITGESMPVEKIRGRAVYAGTINQSGALEIRTERIGRDTSYGKIIEAVEHAERVAGAGAASGRSARRHISSISRSARRR